MWDKITNFFGDTEALTNPSGSGKPATKQDLEKVKEIILMKLSELGPKITAVTTQLEKAKTEIIAAFQDVELTPEQTAALDGLTTVTQSLDDLNPDKTPS